MYMSPNAIWPFMEKLHIPTITSIKTHLKGDFGFKGTFDLAFLLIEEILQEVQNVFNEQKG